MADYFGNLVGRVYSATDAVQPRVRSIFEPPATFNWPPIPHSVEMESHGLERSPPDVVLTERLSQIETLNPPATMSSKENSAARTMSPRITQVPGNDSLERLLSSAAQTDRGGVVVSAILAEAEDAKPFVRKPAQPESVRPHRRLLTGTSAPIDELQIQSAPVEANEVNSKPNESLTQSDREGWPSHPEQHIKPDPFPLRVQEVHLFKSDKSASRSDLTVQGMDKSAHFSSPVLSPSVQKSEATRGSGLEMEALTQDGDQHDRPAQAKGTGTISPILSRAVLQSPRLLPVDPESAREESPTILVTIGRVEVRAATPNTPPARQRVAAPAMTLDAYLRQRVGDAKR